MLSQKEPKLTRARQIPECELYDVEIARFTRSLADEGHIHTSAAVAGMNELVKVGSVPVAVVAEETVQGEEGEGGVSAGPVRDEQ